MNKQGDDLRVADLYRADLTGGDLRDANLGTADLSGATPTYVILARGEMSYRTVYAAHCSADTVWPDGSTGPPSPLSFLVRGSI